MRKMVFMAELTDGDRECLNGLIKALQEIEKTFDDKMTAAHIAMMEDWINLETGLAYIAKAKEEKAVYHNAEMTIRNYITWMDDDILRLMLTTPDKDKLNDAMRIANEVYDHINGGIEI